MIVLMYLLLLPEIYVFGGGAQTPAAHRVRLTTTPSSSIPTTSVSLIPPVVDLRPNPLENLTLRTDLRATEIDRYLQAVSRSQASAKPSRSLPGSGKRSTGLVAPALSAQADTATASDDFWRRLANCECSSGHCANGAGYFQFTDPSTAEKAGYVRGSSYEEQLAAAKRWAAKIHPREGTTAGWPRCWWRAGG